MRLEQRRPLCQARQIGLSSVKRGPAGEEDRLLKEGGLFSHGSTRSAQLMVWRTADADKGIFNPTQRDRSPFPGSYDPFREFWPHELMSKIREFISRDCR